MVGSSELMVASPCCCSYTVEAYTLPLVWAATGELGSEGPFRRIPKAPLAGIGLENAFIWRGLDINVKDLRASLLPRSVDGPCQALRTLLLHLFKNQAAPIPILPRLPLTFRVYPSRREDIAVSAQYVGRHLVTVLVLLDQDSVHPQTKSIFCPSLTLVWRRVC